MSTIDISGIDKAELLSTMFNEANVLGMGFLQDIGHPLTVDEAQVVIDEIGDDNHRMFPTIKTSGQPGDPQGRIYFDYLFGKPLKTDIGGDTVDPWGYDRDQGEGHLARIVTTLRAKGESVDA